MMVVMMMLIGVMLYNDVGSSSSDGSCGIMMVYSNDCVQAHPDIVTLIFSDYPGSNNQLAKIMVSIIISIYMKQAFSILNNAVHRGLWRYIIPVGTIS